MKPPYVELRCKSAFSFLEGASLPEDLVAQAVAQGHDALALSDRDGVYGAPRFYRAARKQGLRALVGADLTVEGGERLLLLCRNRAGYRRLTRLITEGKLRHPKGEGRVRWEDVVHHATAQLWPTSKGADASSPGGDLVCLTGGVEHTPERLAWLRDVFGKDHTFVEVQRHLHRREELETESRVHLARQLRMPLVATNDVRHDTLARAPLFDVLTCIHTHTTLDTAGTRLPFNAERHLKPPHEMARLFAELPDAVDHTRRVADLCGFTLADLGYRFPDYPVPAGETPFSYLHALTYAGARTRYRPLHAAAARQLARELDLIEKLQLAGYFLIVWDIVRFCREAGILAQGRGSAANSAVCYALGITAVDPVGMELLFERFLSEERGEWPDIDLDLPSGDQRERVIQYVYQRYGARGAAMTANVITYRGRSAAREVGKVLGFAPAQLDRLSRLLSRHGPHDPGTRKQDGVEPTESQKLGELVRTIGMDPDAQHVRHFIALWQGIQNLPRHLGQHSGGMVLAAGRLDDVVPLEPASMPGRVVVQWDKEDCADLGIIKVDLLGLGMLAALEEAKALARDHEGIDVDFAHLPQNDRRIYDMFCRADTIGVFQVESRAQMATLPRLRPRCFYDLVVEVALIRPGPIVGQMVHPYLNRRQGKEPVTYAHPLLEPILKRTLGVPLFQEQLMRIAMVVAGFTGGEAEELRRAMGFKRSVERMYEIEAKLRAGMTERGLSTATQDEIVRGITSFALYGFPESHAASFALIVYASAYMRVYHLAAFTCALLNAWPMGFYHPATLVKDAERHGLRFLPIDVNLSSWTCRLERVDDALAVRLGLRYVRGLHREGGEHIVATRGQGYASIADFEARTHFPAPVLQTLAQIGAFGSLGHTRRGALWQAAAAAREGGLFAGVAARDDSPLDEMGPLEETAADFAGLGLTLGRHPMVHARPHLKGRGVLRAVELQRGHHGGHVRTAGMVIVRQRPGTAKGFVFLTLEDETGIANIIVAPPVYEAHRSVIVGSPFLVVDGRLQCQDGVTSVKATRVYPMNVAGMTGQSHDFY